MRHAYFVSYATHPRPGFGWVEVWVSIDHTQPGFAPRLSEIVNRAMPAGEGAAVLNFVHLRTEAA